MRVTVKNIVDFYKIYPEYKGKIKVLGRHGFFPILDADKTAYNEEVYEIKTKNGNILKCSANHRVLSNDNWIKIKNLNNLDLIHTNCGYDTIEYIKKTSKRQDLYDLQVEDVEEYYTNNITSHNSALVEAFYYALFGSTIRDVKKEFVINLFTKGQGRLELLLEIETDTSKNTYKIVRQIKPAKCELFICGDTEEDISKDSIANTNKYIFDLIGSNPVICKSCDILSLSDNTPFMAKKPEDKRKFIEDIFALEIFGKMLKELKELIKNNKSDISINSTKYEEIINGLEALKKQRDIILKQNQEREEVLNQRRNDLNLKISETEKEIESIEIPDVDVLKSDLQKYFDAIDKIDGFIVKYKEEIRASDIKIQNSNNELKKIQSIDHNVKCDKCLQDVSSDHKNHLNEQVEKLKNIIDLEQLELNKFQILYDENQSKKTKIQSKTKEINDSINDAKALKIKKDSLVIKLDNLKESLKELDEDIDKNTNSLDSFDESLKEFEERQQETEEILKEFNQYSSDLESCKFILGDDGVKSFIVKKLVTMLNSTIQKYINDLGMSVRCKFDEYFEEHVTNDKGKEVSYWNFSGAERKTVDLACAWAFKDIKKKLSGVSSNVEFLDEIIDSAMDNRGMDLLIDVLKSRIQKNNLCCYAVSHRNETLKHIDGEIVTLSKENGVTKRLISEL